jgi:hypothetical protein
MMNCRTTERYLSAYLDGEMDAARRDALFQHLTECEGCRDLVGEASFHEAMLAGAMKRRMVAPVAIRHNVLSAISREAVRRAPARRGFAWRPAAAMAAALALAGAGWRSFTEGPQLSPTGTEARALPERVAALPRESATPPVTSRAEVPKAAAVPMPTRAATPEAFAVSTPRPAVRPPRAATAAPQPALAPKRTTAPLDLVAAVPAPSVETPIGKVTSISGPGDIVSGRFLSRRDANGAWKDASRNVHAKTHLQSMDDTIVTMALNDGTTLKSNQHTEFVLLRSPSREDPSWGIRLIRGELWVKSGAPVQVTTPSMQVRADNAEFSVRSMDGEDAAVMTVAGTVTASNASGSAEVAPGQATAAVAGAAPEPAFDMANPKGQMDWAYVPAPAPDAPPAP